MKRHNLQQINVSDPFDAPNSEEPPQIITVQTLIVATLAVVSTRICRVTDLTAEFPLTLIGIVVVFPLVFSISGAYKRREAALDDYGSMKAHRHAIFFASRDWRGDPPKPAKQDEAQDILRDLLGACRTLFRTPVAEMHDKEAAVYAAFSRLSLFIKSLRSEGLAGG